MKEMASAVPSFLSVFAPLIGLLGTLWSFMSQLALGLCGCVCGVFMMDVTACDSACYPKYIKLAKD